MRTVVIEQSRYKKRLVHLHSDGSVTSEVIADIEPTLERNKRLQNADKQRGEWFGLYGVPDIFVSKWLHEDGVNILRLPKDELAKFLLRKIGRNPDYKWLRTYGGRY